MSDLDPASDFDPFAEATKRVIGMKATKRSYRNPQIGRSGIITAHLLYDVVACEHRITLDATSTLIPGEVNPFVELLWRRESQYTAKIYEAMRQQPGALDLSAFNYGIRANRTINALNAQIPIILGAALDVDNLRAEPNFLVLEGSCYRVGIIKSGRGKEEQSDTSALKAHYAVELALSIDALERMNIPVWRMGEVYDINGESVPYNMSDAHTKIHTFWSWYQTKKARVSDILQGAATEASYGSICKLCHWYDHCLTELTASDDVTLVPELGRSRREILRTEFNSRSALALCDPADYAKIVPAEERRWMPKKLFRQFVDRAKLFKEQGHPYMTSDAVGLHHFDRDEVFFDVETDPLRDLCYLHGFAERLKGQSQFVYTGYFGDTIDRERTVFEQAVAYLRARHDHIIYHYSAYEKTIYRRLQARYPDVCSEEEIDSFFEKRRAVDLYYDAVFGRSIWPTIDHSLKTLAKYEFVWFSWGDTNPSGAASVEWFDKWLTTGDEVHKTRILVYNEDDCVAMAWLLDAMRKFPVQLLD